MQLYKDAFTGDVLCTDECPVQTVDDFVYEFTGRICIRSGDSIVPEDEFDGEGAMDEVGADFVLRHKLSPTGKTVTTAEEFIEAYGKSIMEQVTSSADFTGDADAFGTQCNEWALNLFQNPDRAQKIQFYASPNFEEGRGQICLVEFRGEEQVPTLILLKAATVVEEQ